MKQKKKLRLRLTAIGTSLCIMGSMFIPSVSVFAAQAPEDIPSISSTTVSGDEDWTRLRLDLGVPEKNRTGSWGTPLGNGVFAVKENGGVAEDVFQLNHSTFWSGDPQYGEDLSEGGEGSYGNSPEERLLGYQSVRQKLVDAYREGISDEERLAIFKTIEEETKRIWSAPCAAQSTFLPLGRMVLNFPELTSGTDSYNRSLDMDGATSDIEFKKGSVTYTRQSFISNPANVMAVKIANDGGEKMKMDVGLELPNEMAGKAALNQVTLDEETNEVIMTGRAPIVKDGEQVTWYEDRGVTFEARVKVLPVNGKVTVSGNKLQVTDADEIILLYTCETSFKDFKTDPSNSGIDVAGNVRTTLDSAVEKGYNKLLREHQEDFRSLFRRLWIDMDGESITAEDGTMITPFDYARHYQYGRYIALSCERQNSQAPQNLLGLWNASWWPPNQSAYYLNENVQKMQVIKGSGNLADTSDALYKLIATFADEKTGGKTAQESYGAPEGSWVVAHSSDIWGKTGMWGDEIEYGSWTSGGIWALDTLYDKYDFTQDIQLLEKYYPLMEGAARFALSNLVEADGVNGELKGYLMVAPAGSPEHWYKLPGGGKAAFDISTAADVQIYNNLFNMLESGAKELEAAGIGYDQAFLGEVLEAREKLVPLELFIDQDTGRLREFYNEYPVGDAGHRHVSQLLGTFMNHSDINETDTPELYYASQSEAQRNFSIGGGGHPDRATMALRLGDPQLAFSKIPHGVAGTTYKQGDWRYWCPIGNSVAEAILDSRFEGLNLMENIPEQWSSGKIRGICGRGGYQLSMEWKDGELVNCTVDSTTGKTPRVFYKGEGVKLSEDARFTVNRAEVSLEELKAEAQEKLTGKYTEKSKQNLRAALEGGSYEEISRGLLAMDPVGRPVHDDVQVKAEDDKVVLTKTGETVQLTTNADEDVAVRWTIESMIPGQETDKIAKVDSNGLVTATGGGKVKVTATLLDGSRATGSIELLLKLPTIKTFDDRDSGIIYDGDSWEEWNEGKHFNGTITNCYNAGDKATFTFSGTGVEFVTSTGGHLGSFSVTLDGQVVEKEISVNAENGVAQYVGYSNMDLTDKEHTIVITSLGGSGKGRIDVDAFNVRTNSIQEPESVVLDQSVIRLTAGASAELHASVLPEDALVIYNWSSLDETIAFVKDGKVSARKVGTTTVSVYPEGYSDMKAECTVIVTADKDALSKLSEEAIEITADNYTQQSYQNLQVEIEKADGIINDDTAGQDVVDAQTEALKKAIEDLVKLASQGEKDALKAAVSGAKSYQPDRYTQESYEVLQEVIKAAETVLNNSDASWQEVSDQIGKLVQAVAGLEDIRADKGNLAELYESVKNMDLTVYTIESAEEFVSALTQTEEILGKENASKKEVAEAEARLIKALAGLEKVPSDEETDYTLAEVVYNAYAGLDMAVYTEESAQAFVTALEAVNDILTSQNAIQEQVDAAVSNLISAAAGLQFAIEKPDLKYQLSAFYESVIGMDLGVYTAESAAYLNEALGKAKEILDTADYVDKIEIAKAEADLLKAFAQLEKIPAESKPDDSTLRMLVEAYNRLDTGKYTPETADKLKNALAEAERLIGNPDVSQQDIVSAAAKLVNAAANLEEKPQVPELKADTSMLKILSQAYSGLDLTVYTDISAGKLKQALQSAALLLQNSNAVQSEVDRAASQLVAAASALELKPPVPQKPSAPILGKGETIMYKGLKYKVTNEVKGKATVSVIGTARKSYKSITIPSSVILKGVKCKVTEIGEKAFYKMRSLKKVTIGSSVERIGKRSFYGDRKLKDITIKSKRLKKVYNEAFKGIYKKAEIDVPSSKVNYYQKLFKNKGQSKDVKIK
ncbi:glycosyl hydrolase family 95 catalytic domain-containing protein [Robinsoniella peoriensis]|uniref:glycosyl hydrolase family 95 catalytic domain-containing protein n=1 Tax=Robinsoniella peoriensis TaxID=180332 RepID=UPI00363A147E